MNKLNTKKIYDLSELTTEERKELFKEIKRVEGNYNYIFHDGEDWLLYSEKTQFKSPTTNAKELFYTLENVQVYSQYLSSKKIKKMSDICLEKEYKYFEYDKNYALSIGFNNTYFQITDSNEIIIDAEDENKTKITYEKFIELFGNKEKSKEFNNLVEVLNEELTEEYNKDKKPSQYKIGIDTFTRCESNMTKEEILTCCKFNIDKYNWRNKGQDLEDLEKIISYANWAIKQLK